MGIESLVKREIRLRSDVMPKNFQDRTVTLFVVVIIPVVYWFELWIILPKFFDEDKIWYFLHFVVGTIALFNVVSNYVSVVAVDTSIKGLILQPKDKWTLCAVCETMVPPRSWHCNICNICILKRDHHCGFTGCCIGHNNLRYFMCFLFYVFITSFYSCWFNLYFIWYNVEFLTWKMLLQIVFPVAMLVFNFKVEQLYLFLTLLILLSCVLTGVLLYHHTDLMLRGMVTHQHKKSKINNYDLGILGNVKEVLGEKWFLTWISAFVLSPLPHNGQVFVETGSTKVE